MKVKSYKGATCTELPLEAAERVLPLLNDEIRKVNAWDDGDDSGSATFKNVSPEWRPHGYEVRTSEGVYRLDVRHHHIHKRIGNTSRYRELTLEHVRRVWRVTRPTGQPLDENP